MDGRSIWLMKVVKIIQGLDLKALSFIRDIIIDSLLMLQIRVK
jgi:hypothetical protein